MKHFINKKVIKKIMIIGIFVLLIFAGQASAFSGGSGTEEDPYIISNQADLQEVQGFTTAYFTFSDSAMIEIDNSTWTPINNFNGYMRGEISNVTISGLKKPLFNNVIGNCEISNIRFFNCEVSSNSDNLGIVFNTCSGQTITIEYLSFSNCSVTSTGDNVGLLGGKIELDANAEEITLNYNSIQGGCSITGKDNIGGLIGKCDGKINMYYSTSNNDEETTINGANNVGGLIGNQCRDFDGNTCNISNFNIVATGNNAGGIIGYSCDNMNLESSTVTSSIIIANTNAGCLIGNYENVNHKQLKFKTENSYIAKNHIKTTSTTEGAVGGLIGKMCLPSETADYHGFYADKVEHCVIETYQTSNSYSGGFIGLIEEKVEDSTIDDDKFILFTFTWIKSSTIFGGNSGYVIGGFNTIVVNDITRHIKIEFNGFSIDRCTCKGLSNACGLIGAPVNCILEGTSTAPSNVQSEVLIYNDVNNFEIDNSVLNSGNDMDMIIRAGIGCQINIAPSKFIYSGGYYHSENLLTNDYGAVLNEMEDENKTFKLLELNETASEITPIKEFNFDYIGSPMSIGENGKAVMLQKWDFGDGTGITPINNYSSEYEKNYFVYGTYTASLTFTDYFNETSSASTTVKYKPPKIPTFISVSITPNEVNYGDIVTFDAQYDDTEAPLTSLKWYLYDKYTDEWWLYSTEEHFTKNDIDIGEYKFKCVLFSAQGYLESQILMLKVNGVNTPVITSAIVTPLDCFINTSSTFTGTYTAPAEHPVISAKWESYQEDTWTTLIDGATGSITHTSTEPVICRFAVTNDMGTVYSDKFTITITSESILFKNLHASPNNIASVGSTITLTGEYELSPSATYDTFGWMISDETGSYYNYTETLTSTVTMNEPILLLCKMYAFNSSTYDYAESQEITISFCNPTVVNLLNNDTPVGDCIIAYSDNKITNLHMSASFDLEGIYADNLFNTKLYDSNGNCVIQNYTSYIENYKWILNSQQQPYITFYAKKNEGLNIENVSITPSSGTIDTDFTLSCLSTGTGTLTYSWYKSQDKTNWGIPIGNGNIFTTKLPVGTWYFKCIVSDGLYSKDSFSDYSSFTNIKATVEEGGDEGNKWNNILENSTKGMTASIIIGVMSALAIIGIFILSIVQGNMNNPAITITTVGIIIVATIIIIILAGGFNGVGINMFTK